MSMGQTIQKKTHSSGLESRKKSQNIFPSKWNYIRKMSFSFWQFMVDGSVQRMQMYELAWFFLPFSDVDVDLRAEQRHNSDRSIWKYLRPYILSAAHVNAALVSTSNWVYYGAGSKAWVGRVTWESATQKKERNASKIKDFSFIRLGFPASTSASPHAHTNSHIHTGTNAIDVSEKKTSNNIRALCDSIFDGIDAHEQEMALFVWIINLMLHLSLRIKLLGAYMKTQAGKSQYIVRLTTNGAESTWCRYATWTYVTHGIKMWTIVHLSMLTHNVGR